METDRPLTPAKATFDVSMDLEKVVALLSSLDLNEAREGWALVSTNPDQHPANFWAEKGLGTRDPHAESDTPFIDPILHALSKKKEPLPLSLLYLVGQCVRSTDPHIREGAVKVLCQQRSQAAVAWRLVVPAISDGDVSVAIAAIHGAVELMGDVVALVLLLNRVCALAIHGYGNKGGEVRAAAIRALGTLRKKVQAGDDLRSQIAVVLVEGFLGMELLYGANCPDDRVSHACAELSPPLQGLFAEPLGSSPMGQLPVS